MPKRKADLFSNLGLSSDVCEACSKLGWNTATEVQKEAIPIGIRGKDVIALAETGSGKTAAFCLPLLHKLLQYDIYFSLILAPTRELALQIMETLESLGDHLGITCVALVGGVDMVAQMIEYSLEKPDIIVATPGRLVEYVEKCPGFTLTHINYLVLDEADKMLNLGFEEDIDKILNSIPKKRQTLLFSATMTSKVKKLKRAHLINPVKIEVSAKFRTVNTLKQFMLFIPFAYKTLYLVAVLKKLETNSILIFAETRYITLRIYHILKHLGFESVPLYGGMKQSKRNESLKQFKEGNQSILIATDVCARGLDIPDVNYVINFDLPKQSKDYIHRVGRTARAGKEGIAITMVSQYDIESFKKMEQVLGAILDPYEEVTRSEALNFSDEVAEGERFAKMEMKNLKKI